VQTFGTIVAILKWVVQWLFNLKLAKMSKIILILVLSGMWVGGVPKTFILNRHVFENMITNSRVEKST
jgi:hypothetical protein